VSVATANVGPHESGVASALLNSSRQIGAAPGLAALGTAAYHRTGHHETSHALTRGYALGLTLDAVLLLVAVVVAFAVLPRVARAATGATQPSGSGGTTDPTDDIELEGSALS
jgi:hypothetical protein